MAERTDLTPALAKILGPKAAPVSFGKHHGWRARARPGMQKQVIRAAEKLRKQDVRLFLGDGEAALYGFPGLPVLDVIEFAQVATWKQVRAVLEPIFERSPFDIVFADEAGLLAVFHAAPTNKDARAWSKVIFDAGWMDSYCMMAEEAGGESDDPVADYLHDGRLRLWWD